MDPLQALQAAYAVPADSKEQADLLATLREQLELQAPFIPILLSSLLRTVTGTADSLLKNWTLDLLHYGLSRANLTIEKRTELATSSLDVVAGLLHDRSTSTAKTAIQCFGSTYPLVFRYLCTNRIFKGMWDTLTMAKSRILDMVWQQGVNAGLKLAALKFMQRVILVQTRGVHDPRLQKPNDPNLSFCPADHPFIPVSDLEAEGSKLIEGVLTIFFTTTNPDMMSAVVNSWTGLVKQRPNQTALIINALCSWNPGSISNFPASTVRGVEKAVRILLVHLSRTPQGHPFIQLINDSLTQQAGRMEQAAANERQRKAAEVEANGKRSMGTVADGESDLKRQKTEHSGPELAAVLANFDLTSLPNTLITDIIVSNLQALTEESLAAAVLAYRQSVGLAPPAPVFAPAPEAAAPPSSTPTPAARTSTPEAVRAKGEPSNIKSEPVDPLQMELDEDDIDYDLDRSAVQVEPIEEELPPDLPDGVELFDVEEALKFADIKMPKPELASEDERRKILKYSMSRIWNASGDLITFNDSASRSATRGGSAQDLWMLLLVRMITRVVKPQEDEDSDDAESGRMEGSSEVTVRSKEDRIREILFDYVVTDFPSRDRLALIWMNEEWYNDRQQIAADADWRSNYETWLLKLINVYEPQMDSKDRTLSRFLLDIPHVPSDILDTLRILCTESDRMAIGFTTLREFVTTRVPLRAQSMKTLLDLTTHPERTTRAAAINTVKKWLPDMQPMADMVRSFALRLLRRLQQRRPPSQAPNKDPENMEDGEMIQEQEEIVQTPYLPEQSEDSMDKDVVLQHVEILFSLCSKFPDFLDEIFDAYGQMEKSIQEAIQELITPLIRSMGPNHSRLLKLMRNFPPGTESLALRILTIFSENGRPAPPVVTLVKALMVERDLNARFLIPIIAEMDKTDILRHLPRIVSMLDGTIENKQLVKSVFESVVTTPSQTFGSVSSNLPRVQQSELLQPAELMVLLHDSEKEIGLKGAIEAIGICFSMADVFRSEILAIVMQQIVDEPVLPVLFLRTVIQAVSTYRSLVGFVSTTLLSRLITKKIWTNAPLWEGFIRCAKVIAPASFGALLQLPKDQLRELVDKQPSLKAGLRDYVLKKAGNKARQAGFLDIFGGDDLSKGPGGVESNPLTQPSQPQPQAVPAPSV